MKAMYVVEGQPVLRMVKDSRPGGRDDHSVSKGDGRGLTRLDPRASINSRDASTQGGYRYNGTVDRRELMKFPIKR